jgi:catechol 2,3-dioxygenase-like lactoylglutathione lyase family enzyme
MPAKAKSPSQAKRQQPESLRLRSVTVTFTVNDLQRSLAWYRDGLGFFVSERWEEGGQLQGVMLKAGTCEVGLSQDDFSKGRDRTKGVGFRLWCNTSQDVDAIAARFRSSGGKLLEEPGDRYGTYGFTVEDPDGFRLTIARERA